jgi:inner membrane protein yjjP
MMKMQKQATDADKQREITRLCIQTALLLLQHGVESTVVVQMASRLGVALGVDSVECALTPNAVILSTLSNNHCITTTRKNTDKGINMQVVTEVQRIVIAAEHHIYDLRHVREKLDRIKPLKYNRYLVVVMVGLSCACFSHLAGGDWTIFGITFIASALAMYIRQIISARHFNPLIVFAVTAFVASLVAGSALKYELGNDPQIALASSVLLLVPGFPLVNSLADILKGHINMGIARWVIATVLTFGSCIGIVFALSLLNITGWGA